MKTGIGQGEVESRQLKVERPYGYECTQAAELPAPPDFPAPRSKSCRADSSRRRLTKAEALRRRIGVFPKIPQLHNSLTLKLLPDSCGLIRIIPGAKNKCAVVPSISGVF